MSFMRSSAFLAATASLLLAASGANAADNYPSKPGRLILPFGAGGSTDIVGRIFAQRFSEAWGQTLVVDNRPGAGGILGTDIAAKSVPDGYTIVLAAISFAAAVSEMKDPQYDPIKDFTAVAMIGTLSGFAREVPAGPLFGAGAHLTAVFVGARADFEAMNAFIAEHEIHPVIDRVFEFEDAPAAFDLMADGDYMGKIVVRVR